MRSLIRRSLSVLSLAALASAGGCVSTLGEQLPPHLKDSALGKTPVNLGTQSEYVVVADENGENPKLASGVTMRNRSNAEVFRDTTHWVKVGVGFYGQLWPVQVEQDVDFNGNLKTDNYHTIDFYNQTPHHGHP
ncbi:MAG: hypothetical protein J0M12_11390 [Deltaproteobacteria bacterium]|nr:hypothetical protein [Deltaproteobacteria bacterium]